jgi:hypothetical protein
MRSQAPFTALTAMVLAATAAPCPAQNSYYPPWPPPPQTSAPAPPPSHPPPPSPPPRTDAEPAPPSGPINASQPGAPPSPQLVTPAQEGSKSVTTAAEAPLHEMNLVRQSIPPVLLAALADPYAYPSPLTCDTIISAVDELDVALGPDFDNRAPKKKKSITGSGGVGLSLMNSAAGNLLPFHGYVGTLSGASKHDALVISALNAGNAQRAYLKGLGEARSCPAPAAPHHIGHAVPPVYDGPRRPKYPIWQDPPPA